MQNLTYQIKLEMLYVSFFGSLPLAGRLSTVHRGQSEATGTNGKGTLVYVYVHNYPCMCVTQEHWPRNGLNMASTLIESITTFKNPAAKMAIQPHSLALVDFSVSSVIQL